MTRGTSERLFANRVLGAGRPVLGRISLCNRMGAAQMDFLKSGYRVARETLRDAMDDKPVFWSGVIMGAGVVLGLLV